MQVDLLRPSPGSPQPDPEIILPTFTQPPPVGVSEPTIEIAEDPQPITSTLTTLDMSQLLAPRPDPRHINMQPALPDRFKNLGSSVSVTLTIFVELDGSVSAAQVAQSSGAAPLDAWVIAVGNRLCGGQLAIHTCVGPRASRRGLDDGDRAVQARVAVAFRRLAGIAPVLRRSRRGDNRGPHLRLRKSGRTW
jgi:hypothetical protein